ncbi:MAG: hypothetical protein ACI4GV_05270 [Acutalibacteraceae bacterium]
MSVMFTVAGISALAYPSPVKNYTSNPETFNKTINDTYVTLGCYKNWTATSSSKSDHQSSFKYASCKSYTYSETSGYSQQSHKANTGTAVTVVTDSATVNGYTQKTEFMGYIGNNASGASCIYAKLTIIVNRTKS